MMVLSTGGCGSKPRERSLLDVQRDRDYVPYVFLTEKTKHEILAPLTSGRAIVDPATGEFAWIAYTCTNPSCPGKGQGQNGRPFLFIWTDPSPNVEPGGIVSYGNDCGPNEKMDDYIKRVHADPEPTCPECAKVRNRSQESEKLKQQYKDWAKLYVPPENLTRMKELDEEETALILKLRERKDRKVPLPK